MLSGWDCKLWSGTRCQHDTCRPGPEAVARHSDPSTSWEAARSVTRIRETQQAVLQLLRRHGPLCDEDIAARAAVAGLPQSPSGLRTRRRELVDLGLVVDSGQRKLTSAGRRTIIWRAS